MLIQKELLSIGEVAQVTGIPVHTIRFWESEFERFISPARTTGRQRRYTETEVFRILEIKKLLKEDKYSIAGAKQVLSAEFPRRTGLEGADSTLRREASAGMGLKNAGREVVFSLADLALS